MTRPRSSKVTVTKADGTIYEIPAYDRRSMRILLNSTSLSEYDRAMISTPCPVCHARPGRYCRSKHGNVTEHRERINAYNARLSTMIGHESCRLES